MVHIISERRVHASKRCTANKVENHLLWGIVKSPWRVSMYGVIVVVIRQYMRHRRRKRVVGLEFSQDVVIYAKTRRTHHVDSADDC